MKFNITATATGIRMSQHGVLISELRTTPGPTHSISDILAALILILQPPSSPGRIGLLGFAGGGLMAPLAALQNRAHLESVDLDPAGYLLFKRYCRGWAKQVSWSKADAAEWLRSQRPNFSLLIDDLSIPHQGDVIKPEVCWSDLPHLIRGRLHRDGSAVFNLLPHSGTSGLREARSIAALFPAARIIRFTEFQNLVLVVGRQLPPSRELGRSVRSHLATLNSRLAHRIQMMSVPKANYRKSIRQPA